MENQEKTSNDYLKDLDHILTYTTLFSSKFQKYIIDAAKRAIESNIELGQTGGDKDFSEYNKVSKELSYLNIFDSSFVTILVGLIFDCINAAYKEGNNNH